MYIVTGGAGLIGSNIVAQLNERGINEILVVDNLEDGKKFVNLSKLDIADYMDKRAFIEKIKADELDTNVDYIFHMGACSATTEWDGRYMMENNYEYSKELFYFAQKHSIPYLYASSAATYGETKVFKESPEFEGPLNVYGYSKLLFDNFVRKQTLGSQVVGFRFFNVYGPGENHKGSMASVAFHHNNQLKDGCTVKLFDGYDGYGPGEHSRDFVYVKDVVKAMMWFADNPDKSGIFNLGTGRAQQFNDIAKAVIKHHGRGSVEYIPFPEHLKNAYQSFTQADLTNLRAAGYQGKFMSVEEGVSDCLSIINNYE